MDSPLVKIDSIETYLKWINEKGYGPHFYITPEVSMTWGVWPLSGFDQDIIPDGYPAIKEDFFSNGPNERNFWVMREYARILDGEYRTPLFLNALKIAHSDKGWSSYSKYWWHAVHVSVSDPTRVAYTPNHEYGMRDRQVVMNMGRYLKKFYGDLLTDDQIRDMANIGKDKQIKWAHTSDEIVEVYENGPQSCMKGEQAPGLYSYKYPEAEGGDYEFGLAYLTDKADAITARALVSLRHKVFPRYYGDEGPILESLLRDQGFKKIDSMGSYPCRILHEQYDDNENAIVMPYLDGDCKRIYGVLKDSAGVQYWQWGGKAPEGAKDERCADCSDAIVYKQGYDPDDDDDDDNYGYCSHCDGHFHNDSLSYSEYHHSSICNGCIDEHYVYAYYGTHNDTTLVHTDDCVFCESDDEYYANRGNVLRWHNVVQVKNGDWFLGKDTVKLMDGRRLHEDDDEVDDLIVAGNDGDEDIYCPRSEISAEWGYEKSTYGGTWYHPDFICMSGTKSILELLSEGEVELVRNFVLDDDKVDEWLDEVTAPADPATQDHFTEMA